MKEMIMRKPSSLRNRKTNYKNLIVWKLGYNLVLDFYAIAQSLPDYERRNIADQMRRAATSLPLNIAEGASSSFKKVFFSQLNYAYGSAKELEVLLMLCKDFNYITTEKFTELYEKLDKFRCHVYRLMEKIEKELSVR